MKSTQTSRGNKSPRLASRPLLLGIAVLAGALAFANAQAQTTNKATGVMASLNKSLDLFVFPAKQQDAATQEQDEQACYTWAVEQSGVDPLNQKATEAETVDKSPDGSAARGATRGALRGLAIGAVAGDAGRGAAIGATGGGIGGVAGKKRADARAEQQAQAAATQKDLQARDSFKKAYCVCLEAKGYTAK
jgi:hypothetical protein